eukprot:756999-Hanusia_phi.AAC.8
MPRVQDSGPKSTPECRWLSRLQRFCNDWSTVGQVVMAEESSAHDPSLAAPALPSPSSPHPDMSHAAARAEEQDGQDGLPILKSQVSPQAKRKKSLKVPMLALPLVLPTALEHRRKKLEVMTSRTSQQREQLVVERGSLTERPAGKSDKYYPALNLQEESLKSRHASVRLPKLRQKITEKDEKLKLGREAKNDSRVVVSLQERVQQKKKIRLWLSFLYFYKSLERLKVYWNEAKGLNELKYVQFCAATRIQRAVLHVKAKKSMISWMHKLVSFNRNSWKFRLALRKDDPKEETSNKNHRRLPAQVRFLREGDRRIENRERRGKESEADDGFGCR